MNADEIKLEALKQALELRQEYSALQERHLALQEELALNLNRAINLQTENCELLDYIKLQSNFIEASPCDPDITAEQTDAWLKLKNANKPSEG